MRACDGSTLGKTTMMRERKRRIIESYTVIYKKYRIKYSGNISTTEKNVSGA